MGVSEKIISFFLNPFLSGLLILVIIGGIYFELQTPGVGFPLFAAITALVLYLVPYYLGGLAEYWEILALFTGLILIMLEVFVIPGFGVAGVLGIAMTVSSMILIMLNNDFFNFDFVPVGDIVTAMLATLGGISGGALLLLFGGTRLSETKAFRRIALMDTQEKDQGYTSNFNVEPMVSKTGKAFTVLRPSGKVLIGDTIYDAFTRGEYIEEGDPIEVISVESSTLRVKKSSA